MKISWGRKVPKTKDTWMRYSWQLAAAIGRCRERICGRQFSRGWRNLSVSANETPKPQYLRFSPLPAKLKNGSENGREKAYIGAKRHFPAVGYYEKCTRESELPRNDELDNALVKEITTRRDVEYFTGEYCRRTFLLKGDMIEAHTRDGNTILAVILRSTGDSYVEALTLGGDVAEIRDSDIAFVVRGVFTLPEEINDKVRSHTVAYMRLFAKNSLDMARKLAPYVEAVYAAVCAPEKMAAVDVGYACERLYNAAGITSEVTASRFFAAYLALTTHESMLFARLDPAAPVAAIPEMSLGAINKILHNFTAKELDECVQEISSPSKAGVTVDAVSRVLQHYGHIPDVRLADAVDTITQRLGRDDSETVTNFVVKTGLAQGPPPLFRGGIAYVAESHIQDGLEEKLDDDLRACVESGPHGEYTSWTRLPVMAFADDLACSLHHPSMDVWTLYIHVPDVGGLIGDLILRDKKRSNALLLRSKTLNTPAGTLPLFPDWFRRGVSFGTRPVDCLTFAIRLRPWRPVDWAPGDVDVIRTRVSNAVRFDEAGAVRTPTTQALKEICDKHARLRFDSGALFREYTATEAAKPVVREARIMAGRAAALFGTARRLDLPYTKQTSLTSDPGAATQYTAVQRRVAATASDMPVSPKDILLGQRFLGPEEIAPYAASHAGLGLDDSFVPVAHPLDDIASVAAQAFLSTQLVPTPLRPPDPVALFDREIGPRRELVDAFSRRLDNYTALSALERRLTSTNGYLIFRCVIIEEARSPDLARAYCDDLATTVDVCIPPTTSVHVGDTVLCTEILHLSAADGVLVLGM